MMEAQDPTAKFEKIRQAMAATGKDMSKLSFQDQKLIAANTGLEASDVKLMLAHKESGDMHAAMSKQAEKNEKKVLSQADAMHELADAIARIPQSGEGGGGIFDHIFQGFIKGIQLTPEFIELMRNLNKVLLAATQFGMKLGKMFVDVFPGVKAIITKLSNFFDPDKFKRFFNSIFAIFKSFTSKEGGIISNFSDMMSEIKTSFFEFFDIESGPGKGVVEGFKTFGKTIFNVIIASVSWVWDQLGTLWELFLKDIENPEGVTNGIIKTLTTAATSASNWVQNKFVPIAAKFLDTLIGFLSDDETIKKSVGKSASTFEKGMLSLWEPIYEGLKKVFVVLGPKLLSLAWELTKTFLGLLKDAFMKAPWEAELGIALYVLGPAIGNILSMVVGAYIKKKIEEAIIKKAIEQVLAKGIAEAGSSEAVTSASSTMAKGLGTTLKQSIGGAEGASAGGMIGGVAVGAAIGLAIGFAIVSALESARKEWKDASDKFAANMAKDLDESLKNNKGNLAESSAVAAKNIADAEAHLKEAETINGGIGDWLATHMGAEKGGTISTLANIVPVTAAANLALIGWKKYCTNEENDARLMVDRAKDNEAQMKEAQGDFTGIVALKNAEIEKTRKELADVESSNPWTDDGKRQRDINKTLLKKRIANQQEVIDANTGANGVAKAARLKALAAEASQQAMLADKQKKMNEENKRQMDALGPVTVENAAQRFKQLEDLTTKIMSKDFDLEGKLKKVRDKLSSTNFSIGIDKKKEDDINLSLITLGNVRALMVSVLDITSIGSGADAKKLSTSLGNIGDIFGSLYIGLSTISGKIVDKDTISKIETKISETKDFYIKSISSITSLVGSISTLSDLDTKIPSEKILKSISDKISQELASIRTILTTISESGLLGQAGGLVLNLDNIIFILKTMSGENFGGAYSVGQIFTSMDIISKMASTNAPAVTKSIVNSIVAVQEMVNAVKKLDESLSKLQSLNIGAKLGEVAGISGILGLNGNGKYTIGTKDVVININLSVSMDVNKVEKVILESKQSVIKDRINYALELAEQSLPPTSKDKGRIQEAQIKPSGNIAPKYAPKNS